MSCNLLLPHEDNIPNQFGILKERHIQMRKPYQLSGWTKNSSYYSQGYNFHKVHNFIMSHVLNHSAMEAINILII